jgi:hypothetical protein
MFIDFKKAYDSVRTEVLYSVLVEFGIAMKLVRLIKMCLSETYSRVWVGKHFSDMFPIKNGFERRIFHHGFSAVLSNVPLRVLRQTRRS